MIKRQVWDILVVLLVLSPFFFADNAAAVDLREVANQISGPNSAKVYGISSGSMIIQNFDSVYFYDKRMKNKRTIELEKPRKLIASENGKFYLILSPGANAETNIAEVFNSRGQSLWTFADLPDGKMFLSPSGEYFLLATGTKGGFDWELLVCHKNNMASFLDLKSFKSIKFAGDGSRFMIDGGPKGVKLYDNTCRLLKSFDYQNGYEISSSGQYLAVHKNGVIRIFDDTTQIVEYKSDDKDIRDLYISEALNRLYFAASYTLVVVNLEYGTVVWDYKTESVEYRFTSLDMSKDNRFLACGVIQNLGSRVAKENRHPLGFVYLFDVGRNIIRKVQFEAGGWLKGIPDVGFWPDGRTILVRGYNRIHTIEMI